MTSLDDTLTPSAGLAGDDLLRLYTTILTIRRFEERVLALRAENLIAGSVHPCLGQEAVPAAAAHVLDPADPIVATYRGHGWAIAAGVDLEALFAEILGRAGGTNGGRGGSAHLSSPGRRFLGENSIVGAGLPIATGAALATQRLGTGEVAVVSFGDGATNQGASHEALVMAVARRLPVVFVCENNGWSEMTAIDAVVPVPLAERARGYGLRSESVDGADVAAVAGAVARAAAAARRGEGPSFVEARVPRLLGHYNADIEHYRPADDKAAAERLDPLPRLRAVLSELGLDSAALDAETAVAARVAEAAERALVQPVATWPADGVAVPAPAVAPLPQAGKDLALGLAVNAALAAELEERPEVVVFGEDVARPGGVFGVTRNLHRRFGDERVFDTAIAESAILGTAVGASMRGLRPVVEIMWADFLLVALDQLVNQAANVRFLSGGAVTAPLVVRTQQGATPGSCAQHSQSLEALLAHVPGLKVGVVSTPHDAYAMTRAAVADDDPVVLIEARALYLDKGPVDLEAREAVGGARLRRRGRDAVVVTWGRMVGEALAAADALAEAGIEVGVLDLRWLNPLDVTALAEAARGHGGRVVVAHEANLTGGFGAEIVARLATDPAAGPVTAARVGAPDTRIPAAPGLQAEVIPDAAAIERAVLSLVP